MSDPVTIQLTIPPVVSICQRDITVPVISAANYTNTLDLELSEPVRGSNVTVTCVQDNSVATGCALSSTVSFSGPVLVEVGQSTATMLYTVTRVGSPDTCLGVQCTAQSQGLIALDGYEQYQPNRVSSSQAVMQSLPPEVKMSPQYLTAYNTSFQSLLYMDPDTAIDVPFQCQASVVGNLIEAQGRVDSPDCDFINAVSTIPPPTVATTTTTPATTTTLPLTTTDVNATIDPNATTPFPTPPPTTTLPPTPPPDPNSPWVALDNSFIVTTSTKYRAVRTSRVLLVIAPVQEIVVTTCCSTLTTNLAYAGLAVATVTVANMKPLTNNTGGVTSGDPGSERFVVKPAFREVAPCPCDLTYLACDINCCCDTECSDSQKETFSECIPGRPGGLDPGPDLRDCKSRHFPRADWFPLMCVQFESNAFLGEFYSNTGKLDSTVDITRRLVQEQKTNVYTYRETEARFSDLGPVESYVVGRNILTIYPQDAAGNLPFPQRLSLGECVDSAPVQFLQDSASTCPRTLTVESCADLTPFSARSYVQASSVYDPACPTAFHVSSTGRSILDVAQRVSVNVNYYCAPNVSAYVQSTTTKLSDLVAPRTVYTFRPGLESVNCTEPCGEDSQCLSFQATAEVEPFPLPDRCADDNSYRLLPAPSYDAAAGVCQDVVLDVRYKFTWAGQEVTGLTADIVVGNVPVLSGSETRMGQKFSVDFAHDYSGPSNQSDNFQQVTTAYPRSGRPGYELGKPVSTGCNSTNTTTGESLPVGQSQDKQIAVWSPGVDGLCLTSRRRFLTFGDNVQSSCALRLTFKDLGSCDTLKRTILNHLNILMPSNVIGRYGYNSPDIDDMWIEILRDDPFAPEEEPTTTPPLTTTTTTVATPSTTDPNATTIVTVTIPTTTTLPTSTENSTQEVPFDPLSLRSGVCRDVVSGIHLEIMYAETGRNNRYPLLEIIGAAVRYTVSNWSMACSGPSAASQCSNTSDVTRPFLLTSSVHYTKVSPTTPQQPILFYAIHNKEKCDSDTCYRFYEDFDRSVCHYDMCWHELFYPLTEGYQGYESVRYTRAFTLVFLLFVIGYLAVAKPWR
ncbi:mucin-2-like [Littorina saxatilis]|uniref:mucin-2-like n=1 Tax=Littorina saxatilis TaxID=31220 RepID=UPI0038B4FD58